MSNRPSRKVTAQSHYVVNYDDWDEKNVEYLDSVYEEMVSASDRRRLTRTLFIKALPRSNSVEKHLYDLPRTTDWLDSHEETVEEYQLYRLNVAYEKIKENNLEIKRWRLLRYANIRKELITSKIEAELQNFESRKG
jgi:hypothetical protein